MKIKNKSLLGLLAIAFVTIILAIIPLITLRAGAETIPGLMTFDDGAYIRIDTANDEANTTTGIRFAADVDASIYGKDEIGMIIVPAFVLEDYKAQSAITDYFEYITTTQNKTAEQISTSIKDNPQTTSVDERSEYFTRTGGVFYGVISRILDENYNEEYGAVAYYKDGSTYHYYPCDFTRRIGDVANSAIQDSSNNYGNAENTALVNILKKAIRLTNNNAESLTVNMAVGKTVDLGQVITNNYISANKNAVEWSVTEGSSVNLGFLDNIQGVSVGTSKVKASAYGGKLELDITVNVTAATKAEDVVDYVVEVPSGRDIKVLQLTDTQISDATQDRTNALGSVELGSKYKYRPEFIEENVFVYMRKAVATANPDLILLTGDNVYGIFDDNGTSFSALVEEMDSYKIPWGIVYGNHDNESYKGAIWQNEQLKKSEYCLFNQGVAEGNGNYSIGLKQDGEIKRVFYLMDSNYCGAAFEPTNNNVKTTKGFSEAQMDWYTLSVAELRKVNATVPISMAYHVPDVNFEKANETYMNRTTNGTKYYTIGANVEALNGDFGTNEDTDGLVKEVETIDVSYNQKNLLQIWQESGVDSVFVGHRHNQSMSILYSGIRWTFGLKTGIYDSQDTKNLGGTLATIGSSGAINVEHLYHDDAYAAQRAELLTEGVNGQLSLQGIPVRGVNKEIDYRKDAKGDYAITQKTYPISVEYVKDGAGNSSLAYRLTSSHYNDEGQFILNPELFAGCESISFKILLKAGEFTKELGGKIAKDAAEKYVVNDGKYVINDGFGTLCIMTGNGTLWFAERGVDTYTATWKTEYTAGEWAEVTVPIIRNGKPITSFNFCLSSYTTIYLKDIVINEPAFTLAEEGQTIDKYTNETIQLTTTGLGITYSSDNGSVATVSDSGLVTCGTTAGTAVITVKDKYNVEKTVTINVSLPPADVNYTVNYYYQGANGVYTLDSQSTDIESGTPGATATVTPAAKTGYTVNEDKSVLSGQIKGDGTLELSVYYDIEGLNIYGFSSDNRRLSGGEIGETEDGKYKYTNKYATFIDNGDGTVHLTHEFVSDPASSGAIELKNATPGTYLLITLKYNSKNTLDDNATESIPQAHIRKGAVTVYTDRKTSRDYYSYDAATNKFVKYPGQATDDYVGKNITFVIWLEDTFIPANNWYTFSPAYERNVDVELISYAYFTTAQAKNYFDLADYSVKHYEIGEDNSLVEIEESATTATGFVGTTATATALQGYTLNEAYSTQSGEILADGKLVLNMIYGTVNGLKFYKQAMPTGSEYTLGLYAYPGDTDYTTSIDTADVIIDGKAAIKVFAKKSYRGMFGLSADMLTNVESVSFSYYIPSGNPNAVDELGHIEVQVKQERVAPFRYNWKTGNESWDTINRTTSEWVVFEEDRWESVTCTVYDMFKFSFYQGSTVYLSNITLNYAIN